MGSRGMCMRWICSHHKHRLLFTGIPALVLLLLSLVAWLVFPLASATAASLAPAIPANASCARLAGADPTATNGSAWGATLLPGLGAPGGWFGVPVCANSVNQVAPGGANLSCDRTPTNFAATGCAPGVATSDGYGLTFQCVELVARFAAWAYGASPGGWHGDAPYLWLNGHHPASFSAFANGGTSAPAPGDVLVWGTLDSHGRPWPAGPAGGHVAVVSAVGSGWISFVEENMLGRNGNIPKETTTLTASGGHWTIGRTYGTNGGRALYGWLHHTGSAGQFPTPNATYSTGASSNASSSSTPQLATSSLAQGVVVTGAGALAQLVWSDTRTPDRPAALGRPKATGGATPSALVESLGAPPGAKLAPNQTPAVVTLPTGERYSFVRGQDGRLYAAYTALNAPGALWQALGAPMGTPLTSGAAALWDGRTMVVGALGNDGALWTRSGPAGMLDGWVSLGHPANTTFQGTPVLTRAPGSLAASAAGSAASTLTVGWLALAIGRDGALYEADWRVASATPTTAPASPSSTQTAGWDAWAPVAASGMLAAFNGSALLAIPEPQPAAASQPASAAPAIGAVDALVTDANGRLWLLRRATMDQPWQARAISLPDASATLISAALPAAAKASSLQVYLAEKRVSSGQSASQSASQSEGVDILTSALPLNAASASSATSWASLGATPPLALSTATATQGSSVVVSLGAGLSALMTAQGAQVALTGGQAALRLLAPGASVTPAAKASATSTPLAAGAGSVILGLVAPPDSFSDSFTEGPPDSRWVITSASSSAARETLGGLALAAPAPSGRIAVAQGAPAGAFAITVRVTPSASWQAGGQAPGQVKSQAGILLALDDWNTLALSMRSDGTVALCPVVNGKALQCSVAPAPPTADPSQGLSLRMSQSSAGLLGEASADGTNWARVGAWIPTWLPSADAPPTGAYAPPVALTDPAGPVASPSGDRAAPLLFASLGLFVENGSPRSAPLGLTPASAHLGDSVRFSDLTATVATNMTP